MTLIPVLEIGGSHVTAALVDGQTGVVTQRAGAVLWASDAAEPLLAAMSGTASTIGAEAGATWGAAVPGPFDYRAGVGLFEGVGKFDSLNGVDVGAELRARIASGPGEILFLNDAAAFALGEWRWGAARGHRRSVAITLGTGVGSAFLDDGRVVSEGPEVPPEGRMDLLTIENSPLEDTVSTRAVVAAYQRHSGNGCHGVSEVAERAAAGDLIALRVVEHAYYQLGLLLAACVDRFSASVVVVGGGISAGWSLISPPLQRGLDDGVMSASTRPSLVASADTVTSALRGSAVLVADLVTGVHIAADRFAPGKASGPSR
jgi:glucokinase